MRAQQKRVRFEDGESVAFQEGADEDDEEDDNEEIMGGEEMRS